MISRVCMASRAVRPRLRLARSEEHTSELQSHHDLVCRLLLVKKTHVDAPVSLFNAESRGLGGLGRDHSRGALGVAEHEHRVLLYLAQHQIGLDYQVADRFGAGAASPFKKVIGLP